MNGVRVLAYNVRGARHGLRRVAAAIGTERPDVALINECGSAGTARRLAAALGMQVRSSSSAWPWRREARSAVLVRPPFAFGAMEVLRFMPVRPGAYPRGALVAEVTGTPAPLTVAAVHLGLLDGERPRHARALITSLAGRDGAIVVGGDLNEGPEGEAFGALTSLGRDAWAERGAEGAGDPGATYPADAPVARIDALFVAGAIEIDRCWVAGRAEGPGRAPSDHLAVVADLSFAGSPS